jgi:hypothetical protein
LGTAAWVVSDAVNQSGKAIGAPEVAGAIHQQFDINI